MSLNSESTTEHSQGLPSGHQTGLPTLSQAREAGKIGMELALEKADRQSLGWSTLALNYLRLYAQSNSQFTAYMVTATARLDADFPTPGKDKAWGMVFRLAVKEGTIKKSGQYFPHPLRHGSDCIVWESMVWAT